MKLKILFSLLCLLFNLSGFAQKNWTGFYFGPNAGLASVKIKQDGFTAPFQNTTNLYVQGRGIVIVPGTTDKIPDANTKKLIVNGGLQLGYLKQFHQFVGGIEADFSFFSVKGDQNHYDSIPPTLLTWRSGYGIQHTAATRFNESVRAKMGYVVNNSLAYLTIGYTFSNIKLSASDYWNNTNYWAQPPMDGGSHPTPSSHNFVASSLDQKESHSVKGLTFGLGYEFTLSQNMNLAIEYRHLKLGTTFNLKATDTMNVVRDSRPVGYGTIREYSQKVSFTENQLTARLNFNLAYFTKDNSKNKKKEKKKGKKK